MTAPQYPYLISKSEFTLPERAFGGYIFDCDGTLVHSMPMHLHAWRAALEMNGFPPEQFSLDMHYGFAGMPGPAIVRILNKRFGTRIDPEKTEQDKVAWYLNHHHEAGRVKRVADYALSLEGKKPMAVASGSDAKLVHDSLRNVGLYHLFQTIVTPEQVKRGKPAPDMFLLAAERLGMAPEDCVVFEDGILGMEAAAAAGMTAVFVTADAAE